MSDVGFGSRSPRSRRLQFPGAGFSGGALLALCLLAGMASSAGAQSQTGRAAIPAIPAIPANVVAGKAYGALERSCAGCHQAGRLEGRRPDGGIANILALDEIARDPSLIRPGLPDASRLYNVALTRELHHDIFNDPAVPEPTTLEVQALRDWIGDLPAVSGEAFCSGRKRLGQELVGEMIVKALADLPPERARQTRFLSLAHLYNACLVDTELAVLGRAVASLVVGLSARAGGAPSANATAAIDPDGLLHAVSLTALGWRAADWDKLVAQSPVRSVTAAASASAVRSATGSGEAVLPADWFAHSLVGSGQLQAVTDEGGGVWGLGAVEALVHAWRRPVDLMRVRADLGLARDERLEALAGYERVRQSLPLLQLRGGGTVRRMALDGLYRDLSSASGSAPSAVAMADGRFEIGLVSDKASYLAGETSSFTVTVTHDCFLTLIGVDQKGRGTVLFPSELEPDNRISAGRTVRIPGEGTPYRFRFKDKGRETIVATCSRTHKAPDGIVHDYDRLRFTVLGDWQLFLRERPEMTEARRDDAATDVPRPSVRQRRRGRGVEPTPGAKVFIPDVQTRTAIRVVIE